MSLVDQLPSSLRAYIGCAEKVFGDIGESNTDLVKIHIQSGKLTLLRYEGFDEGPLPKLRERIKIKMREQRVDFFTYSDDRPGQYLTMSCTFRLLTPLMGSNANSTISSKLGRSTTPVWPRRSGS